MAKALSSLIELFITTELHPEIFKIKLESMALNKRERGHGGVRGVRKGCASRKLKELSSTDNPLR